MLVLLVVLAFVVFGVAGGITFRVLAHRTEAGFKFKHWVLIVGAIGSGMLFARFVVNRRGLLGELPESALVVGAALMVLSFVFVAWLLPWLRERNR